MRLRYAISILFALAACGEGVSVDTVTVQSGIFQEENCTSQPGGFSNPCLCKANIQAAQTGDAQIDTALKQAAENNFCAGKPAEIKETKELIGEHASTFTVTRDDSKLLSVLYEHYTLNAGAAHGMSEKQPMIYNRATKAWVEQGAVIPTEQREAATEWVIERLRELNKNQYQSGLFISQIDPANLFSDAGCKGCILYPEKTGWKISFLPYAVAPYAFGFITLPIDGKFVDPNLQ